MNNKFSIASEDRALSCYFRTSVKPPQKKALLKITDDCNLRCAHCFVSAGKKGETMPFEEIKDVLIPRLVDMNVISATLTGGEPFAHPDIMNIVHELRKNSLDVSLCTNGTLVTEDQIKELADLQGVSANVSLDGFRPESHGKFRGNPESFHTTIETIRLLAKHSILKGLLVTPNTLADPHEYSEICEFAAQNGAKYVLMNPLSPFGRGIKTQNTLGSPEEIMKQVEAETESFNGNVELVPIRFPNKDKPLTTCQAGNILYVFTNGDITPCAYLSFATESPSSQYSPEEFIIGNIFNDDDIASKIASYSFHDKYTLGDNPICDACEIENSCDKGCPAAVVGSGQLITGVDKDQCPNPKLKT